MFRCKLLQRFFGAGEHPAGAARAIVQQIRPRLDSIRNRQQDQLCHELHGSARCPVFARFFVVFLIGPAYQLLENRTHRMIIKAGLSDRAVAVERRERAEVDLVIKELFDQRAERIRLAQTRNLVAELEVIENFLHIGRKAIQIRLEIGAKLLAGTGA